jgi:hypothetical protein
MPVSDYFASEGRIAQSETVRPTDSQVVTERNLSLLFASYLNSGHFDVLLPVEGKWRLFFFD